MKITQKQFFLLVLEDLQKEIKIDVSNYGLDYSKDKNKIGDWIQNMIDKKLIKSAIVVQGGHGHEFLVVDLSKTTITYDGELFLKNKGD